MVPLEIGDDTAFFSSTTGQLFFIEAKYVKIILVKIFLYEKILRNFFSWHVRFIDSRLRGNDNRITGKLRVIPACAGIYADTTRTFKELIHLYLTLPNLGHKFLYSGEILCHSDFRRQYGNFQGNCLSHERFGSKRSLLEQWKIERRHSHEKIIRK